MKQIYQIFNKNYLIRTLLQISTSSQYSPTIPLFHLLWDLITLASLFTGVYIAVDSNRAIIFSIRENCSWLCHSLTSTSRVNCNLVQWLCPATGVISIQLMLMPDLDKHTGNTVLYEYHVDLYQLSHTNKSWISITNRNEKQFYYWRWW